jgi:hypothetical protein
VDRPHQASVVHRQRWNTAKRSAWAKFAKNGHDVAWEFAAGGGYTGRMLIDGEIYAPSEATKKFLGKEDALPDPTKAGIVNLIVHMARYNET